MRIYFCKTIQRNPIPALISGGCILNFEIPWKGNDAKTFSHYNSPIEKFESILTDDVVVVAVVVFAIGDYDYDVDVDDCVDVDMDQFCLQYFLFMALIRQTSMHLAFSKPINNLDET